MIRRLLIAGALVAAAAATAQALAQTRPAAPVAVGAPVYDAAGAQLGRVEAVVSDSQGRPQQVLVRGGVGVPGRSQLKSLPISSLRPRQDGFGVGLRRSEFDALPSVEKR